MAQFIWAIEDRRVKSEVTSKVEVTSVIIIFLTCSGKRARILDTIVD
jgi:hypothetical protein